MRRRGARAVVTVGVVAIAAAIWISSGGVAGNEASSQQGVVQLPDAARGPFPVVRVVDGDTIIVSDGAQDVRVRLLGIDTPESVKPDSPVECFGPESSTRANQLLAGRSIWLESDPTQDAVDQYGRTLAYVWLDDHTLVNEVLVAEGYAREYTYDRPGTYQSEFTEAQAQAQQDERGLWSASTCAGER